MTKTKVTPLIRMVFLFWLIVSIALVGNTIARLLTRPDWRRGHERAMQLLTLTSTVPTAQVRSPRTDLEIKRLAAAAVWHAGCFSLVERKNPC